MRLNDHSAGWGQETWACWNLEVFHCLDNKEKETKKVEDKYESC